MSVTHIKKGDVAVVVTDGGYGKAVPASQITPQKRGGVGVSIFKFNKNGSNGKKLIFAKAFADKKDEIILVKEDQSHLYKVVDEISELPMTSAGKALSDWNEGFDSCTFVNIFSTRNIKK